MRRDQVSPARQSLLVPAQDHPHVLALVAPPTPREHVGMALRGHQHGLASGRHLIPAHVGHPYKPERTGKGYPVNL